MEAATLRHLLGRLDQLLSFPAAPPLHESDRRAVERWAEEAAAGFVMRREGLKLIRRVESVLGDEITTAVRIEWAKERIGQRLARAEEHEAGTYWIRRDASRRAKQPTHVDVDPAAWRRAKEMASRNGMTIGTYIGSLVRAAVERGLPDVDTYASTSHVFARVDVDKPTWGAFRATCNERGVPAGRGVGLLVEAAR